MGADVVDGNEIRGADDVVVTRCCREGRWMAGSGGIAPEQRGFPVAGRTARGGGPRECRHAPNSPSSCPRVTQTRSASSGLNTDERRVVPSSGFQGGFRL